MRTGTYYLNNSGSRWVVLPKEKLKVILPDGTESSRTAICYESFGNFATVQISYKGVKAFYFPEEDGIKIKPEKHLSKSGQPINKALWKDIQTGAKPEMKSITAYDLKGLNERFQQREKGRSVNDEANFFHPEALSFFGDTMENYGVRKETVVQKWNGTTPFQCWELYRRSPVKNGIQSSAFFTFEGRRLIAVKLFTEPKGD